MSIQAGWNSALGIVAGLDYLKQIRKGQTRTLSPYKEPGLEIEEQIGYDDVADFRKKMAEEGEVATSLTEMELTPGMEPNEKEMVFQGSEKDKFDQAMEAQLKRLGDKEAEAYKEYGNDLYRTAHKDIREIREGALKGIRPADIKRQQQMRRWDAILDASQKAQDAAKVADAAPKNTLKGAMDALMKTKQQGYENIMKGGDYNG